jgi:hypothetical protein
MPESLTRKKTSPIAGARVAGFKSVWWPDSSRNRGRLQIRSPAGFTSVVPAGLNRNPQPASLHRVAQIRRGSFVTFEQLIETVRTWQGTQPPEEARRAKARLHQAAKAMQILRRQLRKGPKRGELIAAAAAAARIAERTLLEASDVLEIKCQH